MTALYLHLDCRYYRGDKPCKFKRLCRDCPEYSPMGKRILMIKLGATGDVLRTTPLLPAFKAQYPDCHITWLTDPASYEFLKSNDLVDVLLNFNHPDAIPFLKAQSFDILACLDKEPRATELAMAIPAARKIGYGISSHGTLFPLSGSSDFSFQLGLDDELKFRVNQKSYPHLLFDMFELDYHNHDYYLPGIGTEQVDDLKIPAEKIVIGFNTGSGRRFATKRWPEEYFVQLFELLQDKYKKKVSLLLLGGPEEQDINQSIIKYCKSKKITVQDTGCNNSLSRFSSIVNQCSIVVTSDTLCMHLGIAFKKQVIVLFGSTCAQEIELYGRGEKLVVNPDSFPCSPCYLSNCKNDVFCMTSLTPQQVFDSISRSMLKLNV